jgi:response regulator RpfG family c-di-GMP phosphodiesterase
MSERILLVDDDSNLLSALTRQLRKRFDLVTALGGGEALATVTQSVSAREPFAVVVCDMRMPGMDGIQVLGKIRELSPDTVRMMLTGNADQETAIAAINKGNIFRFLTKPCPAEELADCIDAGLEQYRLVIAERELLEKTLAGSIKVLADIISLNDPFASGVSMRLREWVRLLSVEFGMAQRWQLEVAAMLSPLSQFAVPPELVEKRRRGEALAEKELALFLNGPEAVRNLISNIPRLSKVAELVYLQDKHFDGSGFPAGGPKGADIPFDARLLKILKDLAEECSSGYPTPPVFNAMERRAGVYDPQMLAKVRTCLLASVPKEAPTEVEVPVASLRAGHIILNDIRLSNGHLVLAANSVISPVLVERLRAMNKTYSFQEPVRVRI